MVKRCRQRPTRPMLQGSEVHNSMHNSIRRARKLMTCLLFLLFDKPESTEQPTVGKSQVDSICHQITCSAALALGDLPPSCPPTGPTQYDGYIVSLGQWGKSGSQRMGILPSVVAQLLSPSSCLPWADVTPDWVSVSPTWAEPWELPPWPCPSEGPSTHCDDIWGWVGTAVCPALPHPATGNFCPAPSKLSDFGPCLHLAELEKVQVTLPGGLPSSQYQVAGVAWVAFSQSEE